MANDNEYSCRICLESGTRNDFIAPCSCKGTQKWVHRYRLIVKLLELIYLSFFRFFRECLDKWRSMREDKAFSKCTECQKMYKLISLNDDSLYHRRKRQCLFSLYVIRDVSFAVLLMQVVILFFSFLIWSFDNSYKGLLISFHCLQYPKLFYYLAGIFVLLSLTGIFFMIQLLTGGSTCRCYDSTFTDVYLFSSMNDPICFPCCYGNVHSGSSVCCCGDCAVCTECTSCTECGSIASLGGEVAIVIFVILALVGLVIAVFAGILFVQQVLRKHVIILQKQGLAKEIIVADLAADDELEDVEKNISKSLEIDDKMYERVTSSQTIQRLSGINVINSSSNEQYNSIRQNDVTVTDVEGNLSVSQQRQLMNMGLL